MKNNNIKNSNGNSTNDIMNRGDEVIDDYLKGKYSSQTGGKEFLERSLKKFD
jgi:hypothetical protein